MDKVLDSAKPLILNQDDINNLNRPVTNEETESNKKYSSWEVVAHAFNNSTQEAEADRSL